MLLVQTEKGSIIRQFMEVLKKMDMSGYAMKDTNQM